MRSPSLRDRHHVLHGAVFALPARLEAGLVGVGGDHLAGRADVDFAGDGIDDDRVAGVGALHDAARLPDRGDAERLGDDGDMARAGASPR